MTIKPMNESIYFNQFQIHEQCGTFNGINTCIIINYRKFYFTSKISSEI